MKNLDNKTKRIDEAGEVKAIESIERIENVEGVENPESEKPESEEAVVEAPRMYTEQEMQQRIEEAYLRGRNEQIESRYVADTAHLSETDGVVPESQGSASANPATDGSWIRTRTSVWG